MLFSARPRRLPLVPGLCAGIAGAAVTAAVLAGAGALGAGTRAATGAEIAAGSRARIEATVREAPPWVGSLDEHTRFAIETHKPAR